jgi:hypothetical protein
MIQVAFRALGASVPGDASTEVLFFHRSITAPWIEVLLLPPHLGPGPGGPH